MSACGNKECCASTGIHDGLTFGSGKIDFNGFWENPCCICARAHEEKCPEDYPCWPFDEATCKEWEDMSKRALAKWGR